MNRFFINFHWCLLDPSSKKKKKFNSNLHQIKAPKQLQWRNKNLRVLREKGTGSKDWEGAPYSKIVKNQYRGWPLATSLQLNKMRLKCATGEEDLPRNPSMEEWDLFAPGIVS